jgi:hypothetical protein
VNSELDVLREVVSRLEAAAIPYMLTGSLAMSIYAEPRMTRDLDFVVELSPSDAGKVLGTFSGDFYISDEAVSLAVSTRGMFNLFHLAKLVKVDFIVRKDDEYRRLEFSRRRRLNLGGLEIWVASLEDLILSKLVWIRDGQSAQQRRDVSKLLGAEIDNAYLAKWGRRLGVEDLLLECRNARHRP